MGISLNIGCGCEHFPDCINIDIDPNSRADIVCDVHKLPFKNESVNTVFLYEVLEHLRSPLTALNEIYRVLKPHSILFLSIPNVLHWRSLARWILKNKLTVSPEHIQSWRICEIENLLKRAKFQMGRYHFSTTKFHRKNVFDRILPKKLGEYSLFVCGVKAKTLG